MPRLISCGVIVRRAFGELLLGHATGRNYWDIPKGVRDDDETSMAAALRELREEAGIELDELRNDARVVHVRHGCKTSECTNICREKTCICSY